jgi:hypothetical protein
MRDRLSKRFQAGGEGEIGWSRSVRIVLLFDAAQFSEVISGNFADVQVMN